MNLNFTFLHLLSAHLYYTKTCRALYKSTKKQRRRALTLEWVTREKEKRRDYILYIEREKKFAIVIGIGREAGAFNSTPFSSIPKWPVLWLMCKVQGPAAPSKSKLPTRLIIPDGARRESPIREWDSQMINNLHHRVFEPARRNSLFARTHWKIAALLSIYRICRERIINGGAVHNFASISSWLLHSNHAPRARSESCPSLG